MRFFPRDEVSSFADHIERHALANRAFGVAIGEHRHICVRVEIDKAWCHHHALRVDHALPQLGIEFADLGDVIATFA